MGIWLKVGCFVTGYNHAVLKNCSEVAKKTVKKYTAAMIIMCLLWALIGYSFAERYLHASWWGSIVAALLFIVVVIQIERQIILQNGKNKPMRNFRTLIAIMMAILGSLIIDQIIFKDDIELEKVKQINRRTEEVYAERAKIIATQLDDLKSQKASKDSQRAVLETDVQIHPFVKDTTIEFTQVPVGEIFDPSTNKKRTLYRPLPNTGIKLVPNPGRQTITSLDTQINVLQRYILGYNDTLFSLRKSIQKELEEKTGFLQELNIMIGLLLHNISALLVYLVWFVLLISLECLILMNKSYEKETDYDAMITHQMDTHLKKLALLSGNADG